MTSLKPYNTFQVEVFAKDFIELNSLNDLKNNDNFLILGLGANILFTKDFDGLVIKNNLKGRKVLKETDDEVLIEVASGENWSDLVGWSVDNGWSGVENLAYIPGTVGAAAVGNIGAYGQTVSETIDEVKTLKNNYKNPDCQFDYRESIFKKNKELVTAVVFKLFKTAHFATDYQSRYESLRTYLPEGNLTPKIVAEAVIKIRQDKLPDWTKIATAGSFFKNPTVTQEKLLDMQKEIVELQSYPAKNNLVKLPAGRLLDELGWKGKRIGNVATHEKHALIVINCGGASGQEILDFTLQMQSSVKQAYDIDLEPEVNII